MTRPHECGNLAALPSEKPTLTGIALKRGDARPHGTEEDKERNALEDDIGELEKHLEQAHLDDDDDRSSTP
jgi:hypothetical protein